MKIAQLLPTTLIEYPGKVAALIYTAGCNFRCPFCHNSELVLPDKVKALHCIPEDDVLYFLRERQGFLDALAITGGEPTLQPDLAEFLARVKGIGYLIKLDTNGSNPGVLARLFDEKLVDYVAMDVKGPEERYSELAGVNVDTDAIKETIRLIIDRAPDYEFRTTVAPTITADELEETARLIEGAKRYFLQAFVVPEGKEIVDPSWSGRTALTREKLRAIWAKIKGAFSEGGVR